MPDRRRLRVRPEPADHHAVPRARPRRRREPRLPLGRAPADDDRRDEAARALLLADDDAARRWPRPAGACSSTSPSRLAAAAGRDALLDLVGTADPLTGDALRTVARARRLHPPGAGRGRAAPGRRPVGRRAAAADRDRPGRGRRADRAQRGVRRRGREREIATLSGPALLDFIRADLQELQAGPVRPAQPPGVSWPAMEATLVAQRAAGRVAGRARTRPTCSTQSVPAQRHVADGAGAARRRRRDPPASGGGGVPRAGRRRRASSTTWPSSRAAPRPAAAIEAWLDRYGMRGVGEIDITRPRWRERPATLVPRDPRQRPRTSSRARARGGSSRGGRRRARKEQRAARAPAGAARRRGQGRRDRSR